MAGIFSALGSAFSGVSKSISSIASSAARSASRAASSASRAASSAARSASRSASRTVSNVSRAVTAVTRSAGKSATGIVTSTTKPISIIAKITATAATAAGKASAGAANTVVKAASSAAGTVAKTATTTATKAATTAAKNPIKTALALTGGAGAAIVAGSTLLNQASSSLNNSNKSGISTTLPAATTPGSTVFPDFSVSGVYNRIKDTWDTGNGSAENAALFLGEGREGNSTVSVRDVIKNTLGIGNSGDTLYKTTYDDGAFEIRDYRGEIVSSGSEGAAWALTPKEKAASVNAYQLKNQAKMQKLADNGDSAAQAWLDKYGVSDSEMNNYSAGKVWAGQTDSTTTIINRQVVGSTPASSNEGGGFLSGILSGIFGSSEPKQTIGSGRKSTQPGGIAGSISSGYDSFYSVKTGLYDTSGKAFESGDFAKGALAIAPAAAVDIVAPLDLMQVGNKILTGRMGEITQDELIGGGIDAGLLAFGAVTGGTGYFAGKALKAGLKSGLKTGAKTGALLPAVYAGEKLAY